MFPTKRTTFFCVTALAAVLSILATGCGSSNNGMSNNAMSQAQAQAVSAQVSQAMAQALAGAVPATVDSTARPSLSTAVENLHPDTASGCTPTSTGQTCNFPISLSDFPCTGAQGGTISVNGDINGTLNNSGAGSVSGQFTITPSNCSVSNLLINGDPSISVAGKITFTSNQTPVFPVTFTETGGISYGPNPSGSCQVNATYTINSSLSCTVTGTVCGQSVSGSC